jgi:hypothetical protein
LDRGSVSDLGNGESFWYNGSSGPDPTWETIVPLIGQSRPDRFPKEDVRLRRGLERSAYVPFVGAVYDVDLGMQNLTTLGVVAASRFVSTVITGTAPFTVASTTLVSNLNADLLDGHHSSDFILNPMTTLGDLIFENATPAPDRLPGNTTTTQKFLAQTGNGTISGAPSWQPPPISGLLTYFFYDTASGVANTKLMLSPPSPDPKTSLATAGLTTGAVVYNWLTANGSPGLTFLPDGLIHLHIHAAKTAGTKAVSLFAEIWETDNLGADHALIATTENTTALTGSEAEYDVFATLPSAYVFVSSIARVLVRIKATVTGGGTAPTATLYYRGLADSRVELPTAAIDANNFVPYSGATNPLDLGVYPITADQLISTIAIGNPPLQVTSTTMVPNLNADSLDGNHGAAFVKFIGSSSDLSMSANQITAANFISVANSPLQPYACTSAARNVNLNADLLDGNHAAAFLTPTTAATILATDTVTVQNDGLVLVTPANALPVGGERLILLNNTAGTNVSLNVSPAITFRSFGWNGASAQTDFLVGGFAQHNDNPEFQICLSKAGAAATKIFGIDSIGQYSVKAAFAIYNTGTSASQMLALSNSAAATALIPAQWSPWQTFLGTMWDTGASASKTGSFHLLQAGTSGNPAVNSLVMYSGYASAGPVTLVCDWEDNNTVRAMHMYGSIVADADVKAATFHVGTDAGIDATVALAKLTPVTGSNGSLTVKKGIITAYVAPT